MIADTSPIISLLITGNLPILEKMFENYYLPKGVYDELMMWQSVNLKMR